MRIQPYVSTELQFAYAYHIYYRWQTWRRRAINVLSKFDQVEFQSLADTDTSITRAHPFT